MNWEVYRRRKNRTQKNSVAKCEGTKVKTEVTFLWNGSKKGFKFYYVSKAKNVLENRGEITILPQKN